MPRNRNQRVESSEVDDLVEELDDRRRRALRRGLWGSLAGHVVFVAFFALAPAPTVRPLQAAVTVNLIAGIPKPAVAKRPAAVPAALPKPTPAAKPKPPPPPKPAKKVLPKQPAPLKKKPRKAVKPKPRPRPQELDYDDALAKLRDDLGEPEAPPPDAEPPPEPETGSAGGAGTLVSPETLRWIDAVKRHVRSTYVTPPEFLNRSLETCMTVFLTADGRLMGEPAVNRSSGDIFWDDNSVRAMLRASPLPAPPGDGEWVICYTTEERE